MDNQNELKNLNNEFSEKMKLLRDKINNGSLNPDVCLMYESEFYSAVDYLVKNDTYEVEKDGEIELGLEMSAETLKKLNTVIDKIVNTELIANS